MTTQRILAVTLCALIVSATTATAQRSCIEKKLAKAEANYIASLRSENDGVVESALAQIAQMKLRYPDLKLAALEAEVAAAASNGRTPAIRFKAAIVTEVINNPDMFLDEASGYYVNADALLGALAARLQSEFVMIRVR